MESDRVLEIDLKSRARNKTVPPTKFSILDSKAPSKFPYEVILIKRGSHIQGDMLAKIYPTTQNESRTLGTQTKVTHSIKLKIQI